ncbi:DMT family transporter [Veillonella montpellierensis]|uniref:DMT family transporter n=1 Tax=Veillonella montpellierensis TaxID=187328 RepID=UPI0004195A1D|nr:DMT family transporter [Veillonella montpellierensis]
MGKRVQVVLWAFITILFWASAFPFTKYVIYSVSATSLAEARMIIGALVLLLVTSKQGLSFPRRKDWILFIGIAIAGNIGYQIVFSLGILSIPAATSSIIMALTPLTVASMAYGIYKERLHIMGWLCIITAFIGVGIVLLWDGMLYIQMGAIWTLLGMLLFAGYTILSRELSMKGYTPLTIATWGMVVASFMGIPWIPSMIEELAHVTMIEGGMIFFLGALSSAVAFITWAYALELAEKTADVTCFMFLSPVIVTGMSWALLGEFPNRGFFIGGALIIISLFLFNKYR